MVAPPPPTPSLPPGSGQIQLLASGRFSHLAFCYPLKLLSPTPLPASPAGLRVVYLLSYGGGLVGGDRVWLDVGVEQGGRLVLLTQGTTKVFRSRPSLRLASKHSPTALPPTALQASTTSQTMIVNLAPASSLFLLPSPTSCFARARYTQRQRFNLPTCGTASLVVLDWFNSGRAETGASAAAAAARESWQAERMEFYMEAWWGPARGMCERVVLTADDAPSLEPYAIFGTVLLAGPLLQPLVDHLLGLQAAEPRINRALRGPPAFMWSLSVVEPRVEGMAGAAGASKDKTAVLRVCGKDSEEVKEWLRATLGGSDRGMGALVGEEMWERAMS